MITKNIKTSENITKSMVTLQDDLDYVNKKLDKSISIYKTLFDNSPDAIAFLDKDHRVLDINPLFTKIFGYTLDECKGTDLDYIVSKKGFEDDSKRYTNMLFQNKRISVQATRYTKDQKPVPVNARGILVEHNNEAIGAYGIYTDISDIKKSQTQLMESEKKSRAIINALPDITFIIDTKGIVTDFNSPDDDFIYVVKDKMKANNLFDLVPEEMAREAMKKINKAISKDSLQTFEYSMTTNEELLYFETRIVKLNDDSALGVSRDITKEKLHEQKLEHIMTHDSLTGLYNRIYFENQIKKLDKSKYYPLTVLVSDLNGLKLVNDAFGPLAGDKMLKRVAGTLKQSFEKDTLVARLGGDEFAVVLPNTDKTEIDEIVKKIIKKINRIKVCKLNVSMSFGWETKTDKNQQIYEVISKAEDSMNKKKLFEIPSTRGKTINTIINTLHEKNKREEQHSHRVSELCEKMGEAMKLSQSDINELKTMGLLHDIGKVAIDERILNKNERLSKDEKYEMKKHPEIGYRILSSVNDMAEMANYVLAHHEKIDGSGYPKGLLGDQIPLQSKIIAIADAYDAMTRARAYRDALSEEYAVKELIKYSGTQFDPGLVKIFISCVLKRGAQLNNKNFVFLR